MMPIKPENKKRYPQNWKKIRSDIMKRANNCCEFCGIENYSIRENGSKVVLTVAHLDHTPENCDYGNLRALCQKCHNNYDKEHRAETRRKTREERDMIHKTIDGYETSVHPSMEQAAIDQGIRPVGYDAPITTIATDFTMMEIGYRKACKHMIERLKAVKKDNDYRFDRIHIADNEFGLGEWYLKIAAAIGIAEDLLAEADHWVKEESDDTTD